MNYLRAGEEAFLFYPVKRQDLVGKKLLSVQEKYYIADHGIREAVFGGNLRDINLVLENIVFLELLRRGYQVTVGKFKDKEVDFIAQKQEKRIYIQVTYLWLPRKPSGESSVSMKKSAIIIPNTLSLWMKSTGVRMGLSIKISGTSCWMRSGKYFFASGSWLPSAGD